MIKISSIVRSSRKTLSVVITPQGEVIVKAPLNLTDLKIHEFLLSKKSWIENKLSKVKSNANHFEEVINYKKLMLFGNIFSVYKSNNTKKVIVEENRILIPQKWEQNKILTKITKWYKQVADEYIIKRIETISKHIKMLPKSTKCTGSRGRWGACNNKDQIFLNFRCVLLPKGLIDYIIIHELAHLVELNHSTKFWQIVESILPSYKLYRKELKNYGFVLKLF